ncbi:MAG TPA: hypothetical protein VMG36_02455 [Thermoplasmata archaeon]|nr:hypothetical protein [Thermoplasmata archaeon]
MRAIAPLTPSRLSAGGAGAPFVPVLAAAPPLPPVDWSRVGRAAPGLPGTSAGPLPKADAVVLTWADAEWAAMEHVFCASATALPYSRRTTTGWSGWQRFDRGLPSGGPAGWTCWGFYRLVDLGGRTVLLFKSNTHLDWPGAGPLAQMIALLTREAQPKLLLSIGTAGGAQPQDHLGTVRAVSAATRYEDGVPPGRWPVYSDGWTAPWTVAGSAGMASLLLPIPSTAGGLDDLRRQFNAHYGSDYSLAQLDPAGLDQGDPQPRIENQTGGHESLLTTSSFVVGTTAGDFASYACIEMDDAVVAEAAQRAGVAFGSVRNVSDPVQNPALPTSVQGNWASAVYTAYGLYTSFNGALAAWAVLVA